MNDRHLGGRIVCRQVLMQVEKKRACTSCGWENAPDAGSRVVVFLLVRRR